MMKDEYEEGESRPQGRDFEKEGPETAAGIEHWGHRERLKRRFYEEGLADFEPHNVLELLLFFAIPRQDTNVIAHELLRRFGLLEAIFAAPEEQLRELPDLGENAVLLLRLIPELAKIIESAREKGLWEKSFDFDRVGSYLFKRYEESFDERIYALFFDDNLKYKGEIILKHGSLRDLVLSKREILDAAAQYGAKNLALAHNHPDGSSRPSADDLEVSRELKRLLRSIGGVLLEHYVVGRDSFCGTEHR